MVKISETMTYDIIVMRIYPDIFSFMSFKLTGPYDELLSTHWGRDMMATIFADNIFKCIFLNENI